MRGSLPGVALATQLLSRGALAERGPASSGRLLHVLELI